tara:strand:+ start:235 stop:867 length:633 start_codon:yes stop_codon:yes gene_type:complete
MDYKILIPLAGVILGWALGSLSGFFKTRNENKRLIGKSISQLYYFIFELKTVIPYLEKVKDNMSTEQYESHRQYVIERHTLKNENSNENINEIIDNISSIYPMLGIELRQLLEGYLAQRRMKFDSSKYEKKLYLLMLSTYEVHRDLTIDKMEEILIKLSFKHNIVLGFKMKKNIRNQNTKLKDVEKSVIDSIIRDIDEEFQNVKNKNDNN